MLNHITIMGRLTRDPELRRTGSGVAVASFTVAVDRDFGGRDGGEKETDFIDCVAWRQTGEFVSKYFTKGRMIVVSGRLQIRNWTDKDGNPQEKTDWFTVDYFSKTDKIAEYLQKGQSVLVEGQMSSHEYEKDGQKRIAWAVRASSLQLLGGKKDEARAESSDAPF
mgnify:CR=1 FL=1